MMKATDKIGLGGGCHWCTEAVFQSLKGVTKVEQGYIASEGDNTSLSEAIIVDFSSEMISLQTLIEIHLHTHKSTSDHSFRKKYRSAVYYFSEAQKEKVTSILSLLQGSFQDPLSTKILPFKAFKPSRASLQNYYKTNPQKPFCELYIAPKLKLLLDRYHSHVKPNSTMIA